MLHHQSKKTNNDYWVSVLNKIEDTSSSKDNAFPVNYEDIYIFQDAKNMCNGFMKLMMKRLLLYLNRETINIY